MAASTGFSPAQRAAIDRAIREAETVSRREFSVFVGAMTPPTLDFARSLHSRLSAPAVSVLVAVDPTARELQVVTGATVRRSLDDNEVGLAVTAMHADFAAGDLVGGLVRGVQMLGEHARAPEMRHADQ